MENTRIYIGITLFLMFWLVMGVFSAFKPMPVFSEQTMLESTWHHKKQRDNITTSEGQGYTLLRAV